MANVNESAYGSKDLWYSISYSSSSQFPASVPKEERNMLANFTDAIPSETYVTYPLYLGRAIYEIEVNGNQTLRDLFYNTVFDRSICFVGQSGKSSYTSIRFFDNQGTNSNNPNVNELPTQAYDVVNLAFSYGGSTSVDYGNGVKKWEVIGADIDRDPSGNALKFDAIRWNPLGWLGLKGTNYYYMDYGFRNNTTFVTNMGVKRNVLVSYVKAGTTDTSDTNAIQTYDLKTYLTQHKETKPYVYSIGFEIEVMYGENIEASSSNKRTADNSYRLMLMENINSLNDFYQISPNNNWQTEHYNNDLFVPHMLKSPHIPVGGYLNNGSYSSGTPSTLGYESTLNSVGVHAVIDCNDIKWDTWVNVGSSAAEGTCNKILVADARKYTEEEFREAVRHSLACFGMFFADSETVAQQGKLDDPDMHLGTIVNGVGYGDYTSGADNRDQPQWNWDSMSENDYDPENPPRTDPNTYENTSGFNPAINAPDGFNKRYVLSELDIRTLREDFFQALESKPEDIDYINYTMSEFLTNNPIDCIVSLKWFPFTVPSHGSEVNINLGNYQTNVHAPVYTGSGVEVYSLGSCVIYPYAGSGEPCFLDYAPYTKMELIIPYCGTVELDPSIYMNHTLSVNFIVDIYTGACTAYIMCDGLVSDSVSGVCCVDLPISGIDNATLEGQIYNASLNLKSSKIGEAVSVVSGGLSFGTSLLGVKGSGAKMAKGVVGTVDALTGAIGSVAQSSESLAMNQYQIEHINIPFRTVGSQTGLGNAKQEQFCRLLIYRPKFINGLTNIIQWYNSNEGKLYGHTVGYSCIKTDVISSFHGFTMFSNVDLSGINATDTEKSAILTALQSGVILP